MTHLFYSCNPIDPPEEQFKFELSLDDLHFLKKEMFSLVEREKATCEGRHSFYAQALVEFLMRYEVENQNEILIPST
jgi:hypothetical protein